ncbi:accessory gene regulator B family protein [Paenibacillus filicis]|uniref:Accessory gene regulator B family protein n=1 Tax=Paenibacillus filicis TaxID=669464 RepID=A0ABU9DKM6_9BACL
MKDPIDYLSDGIAGAIKRANPEETVDKEVMSYALSLGINMVLTIGLFLLVGYLTNNFILSVGILIVFAVMRTLAKGIHIKSLTLCVIVTVTMLIMVLLIQWPSVISIPAIIAVVLLVLIKSPVNWIRKSTAIVVAAICFTIGDIHLVVACLCQAITLVPLRR